MRVILLRANNWFLDFFYKKIDTALHLCVSVDNPLVVSILDGSTLRLLSEDEDDFAMLAENLFTDLDAEDKGKISKSEIRNALVQMGVEMGVPPFSGSFCSFSLKVLFVLLFILFFFYYFW